MVQDGVLVGVGHDLEDFCVKRSGVFDLVAVDFAHERINAVRGCKVDLVVAEGNIFEHRNVFVICGGGQLVRHGLGFRRVPEVKDMLEAEFLKVFHILIGKVGQLLAADHLAPFCPASVQAGVFLWKREAVVLAKIFCLKLFLAFFMNQIWDCGSRGNKRPNAYKFFHMFTPLTLSTLLYRIYCNIKT